LAEREEGQRRETVRRWDRLEKGCNFMLRVIVRRKRVYIKGVYLRGQWKLREQKQRGQRTILTTTIFSKLNVPSSLPRFPPNHQHPSFRFASKALPLHNTLLKLLLAQTLARKSSSSQAEGSLSLPLSPHRGFLSPPPTNVTTSSPLPSCPPSFPPSSLVLPSPLPSSLPQTNQAIHLLFFRRQTLNE